MDRTNIFENKIVDTANAELVLERCFESSLRQTSEENKALYSEIKNAIMKYSGVKSRMLKYDEVFRASGVLAKIRVYRKSLYVYLRIRPEEIDKEYIKTEDKGHRNRYKEVPCMIKVTGSRKTKRTIELIDIMFEAFKIGKRRNFEPVDYVSEYAYVKNGVIRGNGKEQEE